MSVDRIHVVRNAEQSLCGQGDERCRFQKDEKVLTT